MSKEFIKSCKLLQKHYTRITAETHSKNPTRQDDILNKANQMILQNEEDMLIDQHIENVKENTIAKYTKELEQYLNAKPTYRKTTCEAKRLRWNDDIWDTPEPRKNIYKSITYKKNKAKRIEEKSILSTVDESTIFTELEESNVNTTIADSEIDYLVQAAELEYDNSIKKKDNSLTTDSLKITSVPKSQSADLSVKKIELENNKNINYDEGFTEEYEKSIKKLPEKENRKQEDKKVIEVTSEEMDLKIKQFLNNLEKHKQECTRVNSLVNMTDSQKTTIKKSKSATNLKPTKIENTYENRYKAQREIIETQKQKLQEQQRVIEELKLKKIHEQAQTSLENCSKIYQETVKNSEKSRWKTKLVKEIKTEVSTNEIELHLTKAPKIVQIMEERAKEREERRQLIKERKQILDEKKKRLAEEKILKKQQEEHEEKEKRLQALKIERKRQREIEVQKKIDRMKYLEQNRSAFLHYKKKLLFKGIESLKIAIEDRKIREEIAVKLFEFNTTLSFFRSWQKIAHFVVCEKNKKASNMFKFKVYNRALGKWKKVNLHLLGIVIVLVVFILILYSLI